MGELLGIIRQLREHCPWTGALTHESLVEYLLEEAYEVAETVEAGTAGGTAGEEHFDAELQGELGDILLQVVLHARLAEERGAFTFDDVARGLSAKMVRRNPHVFRPDGSLQDSFPATVEDIVQKWDAVKRAERPERQDPFVGIPLALPALARAQKSIDRGARANPVVEPAENREAQPPVQVAPFTSEEELGELLLAVVHSAHASGFDAERALRGAVRGYQQHVPQHRQQG
ncbi:MazG nucleotide pyrophosphohydrolase domain-containing protein [Arthrobacter sp. SLBN-100]|uniref:MazG nucleotide pyrophosphohydrolase domain-containing protein n=1 Tax=Arthrobacter sp. SLBN-100 TaxID=2768450 RepID=UPI0011504FD6|nr:MazG nucleotide pyrophosphohydrolase domain-containing protein [Arthrobacter sp. SLBN-100]